ncbi:ankyrin repeat domain-containing protein 7 [Neodiprion pinetum]|uniref:ankyrin repeat domain-containing protein 7 n=1 Tax=Neodiprion pinetum TaxID=441929 RepID=UPI0037211F99
MSNASPDTNARLSLSLGSRRGWNPLYYAIVGERTENVKCLIESGTDLESRDFQGRTPLMIAVILSNLGTAKLLLDHGADPTAIDDLGCTALKLAILRNKHELAIILAEYETDVTCKPSTVIHSDYELAEHLMPDLVPIMKENTLRKRRELEKTTLIND